MVKTFEGLGFYKHILFCFYSLFYQEICRMSWVTFLPIIYSQNFRHRLSVLSNLINLQSGHHQIFGNSKHNSFKADLHKAHYLSFIWRICRFLIVDPFGILQISLTYMLDATYISIAPSET